MVGLGVEMERTTNGSDQSDHEPKPNDHQPPTSLPCFHLGFLPSPIAPYETDHQPAYRSNAQHPTPLPTEPVSPYPPCGLSGERPDLTGVREEWAQNGEREDEDGRWG